jgi:hypothetical protein
MKYMFLIFRSEEALQAMPADSRNEMFAAYGAYTGALKKAGVMVSGDPLQAAATATTVRVAKGKTQVLNGPYAEIKEQLGGYYVVDVPDLDAALSWAARCPGASAGAIEVRPLMAM